MRATNVTRRLAITHILKTRGAKTLEQLRGKNRLPFLSVKLIKLFPDEFIRQNKTLPHATNDKDLHVWLMTFDGMGLKSVNGKNVYFMRGFEDSVMGTASKRKNTSPLVSSLRQKPKRPMAFKPLVFDEDHTPQSKKQETPRQRQRSFTATPQPRNPRKITNRGQASRPLASNCNRSKVTSTAIRGQKIPEDFPKKSVRNLWKFPRKFFIVFKSFRGYRDFTELFWSAMTIF
jgi:hypothetical protein